jgi:TM2 domain-containing membrane protein YozV
MDQKMLMMLPGLQPTELATIQEVTQGMNESQQQQFLLLYSGKRREEQSLTILAIIGFFGVAGIHRIVTGEMMLGIIYLFTVGFCGVGTIIDLVNIKRLTAEFNQKKAIEAAQMVGLMQGR